MERWTTFKSMERRFVALHTSARGQKGVVQEKQWLSCTFHGSFEWRIKTRLLLHGSWTPVTNFLPMSERIFEEVRRPQFKTTSKMICINKTTIKIMVDFIINNTISMILKL